MLCFGIDPAWVGQGETRGGGIARVRLVEGGLVWGEGRGEEEMGGEGGGGDDYLEWLIPSYWYVSFCMHMDRCWFFNI